MLNLLPQQQAQGSDHGGDDMSLNSNSYMGGAAEDGGPTVHSTGNFTFGFTRALEGGVHPNWGPAASVTKALSVEGDLSLGRGGTVGDFSGAIAEQAGGVNLGGCGGQINKWGFKPGDEDTTELNLEKNGKIFTN